jgi:hypothetical protein
MDTLERPRLRLAETKQILAAAKGLPVWCRHLLFGLLVWVEERVIAYRAVAAVDEAIKKYEQQHPPTVIISPPVYSETGSDFFDEMRLSAPWKAQEDPSDSP